MEYKYIVYIVTNIINNKIYIGVHKTKTPYEFDGYLGCGLYVNHIKSQLSENTYFHRAVAKYGQENFKRQTLRVFDTLQEALDFEELIVNDEFINRDDTYNITRGGGCPPLTNKNVYQFDTSGHLIKSWPSVKDIIESYGCNKDRIRMCIRDKRSFDNSFWSYDDHIDISEFKMSSREHVLQYDIQGNLIQEYMNATEASQKLSIPRSSICCSVYYKRKTHNNYFLKPSDDIQTVLKNEVIKKKKAFNPIYQYSIEGDYLREYPNISKACYINHCKSEMIVRSLLYHSICANSLWSYDKSDKLKI